MASTLLAEAIPLEARLWIGEKIFGSFAPNVVKVSPHRVIKGPCKQPELEAMQYVAQHTSIPVPKIYATHTSKWGLYIEMEYIKGSDLADAWIDGVLSDEQKANIFADIKNYVGQLRELKPPKDDVVSSVSGIGIWDIRIGPKLVGPFNHEEFQSFLRSEIPLENCTTTFGEEVTAVHQKHHRTHFTHADLVPRNIIVRDGRVVAIIDWAFSGWYPEYWEFTKAHYDWFPRQDWYSALYEVIPRYDAELVAERALWRQNPEPGIPIEFREETDDALAPGR